MESKESSHRQDVACARCRERKVRCGRERPACMNCLNDSVECEYSLPEKRVNHIKLLCRNFERLEGRLSGIEGELSWLTALLKTSGIQKDASSSPSEDGSGDENNSPVADEQGRCSLGKAASNRHVVRSPDNLGDQYYGPGTLLSLCYNLKDTVLSKQGTEQHPSNEDTSRGEVGDSVVSAVTGRKAELVSRICSLASPGNFEPTVDTPEEMEIRLPPKQLLLMVLPQFLSQLNYTIDLFVESHLQQNIEHVYSRPPTTANDAWAICFNTIILLVLDSESANAGNAPLMASQYSLPFFHAMRAALHHAHLLTTPRLINVQALALLSIAAQRYYPSDKAASIFAQACLLSRLTGLHQATAAHTDLSPEECQERQKTFMSLHLRDKTLSLSWYSVCWLPSFDRSVSLQLGATMFADPHISSRMHLADIQEQLYRHLSAETLKASPQRSRGIASIISNLDTWAKRHSAYTIPFSSPLEAEFQLTFLATRMLTYSHSCAEAKRKATLDDARASCIILLMVYGKRDRSKVELLESLRPWTADKNNAAPSDENNTRKTGDSSAGRLISLPDAFPVMAFFLLAQNILSTQDDQKSAQDLELLYDVQSCFAEVSFGMQSSNRASQVEMIFRHVLELIQVIKNPERSLAHSPGNGPPLPQSAYIQTPPNSGDMTWDFLTGPAADAEPSFRNLEIGGEETAVRRKRLRTEDFDFALDGGTMDLALPTDWEAMFNLGQGPHVR